MLLKKQKSQMDIVVEEYQDTLDTARKDLYHGILAIITKEPKKCADIWKYYQDTCKLFWETEAMMIYDAIEFGDKN
jgi:vacuolar-type H+-ATPase subunit D/Vma8